MLLLHGICALCQRYSNFFINLITCDAVSCSQKATITLLPTPSGARLKGAEDLGYQYLAAFGGQLKLFGMPGGESTPSWVRLSATAAAGSNSISVTGDVSNWPIRGRVRHCEARKQPKPLLLISPTQSRILIRIQIC